MKTFLVAENTVEYNTHRVDASYFKGTLDDGLVNFYRIESTGPASYMDQVVFTIPYDRLRWIRVDQSNGE